MVSVRICGYSDKDNWDRYVKGHPLGTFYHLFAWKKVTEDSYGHQTYYLIAEEDSDASHHLTSQKRTLGVFPLVKIKPFVSKGSLVSMPFVDYAGILAEDEEVERQLFEEGLRLSIEQRVKNL
jgi:hypothetical protein